MNAVAQNPAKIEKTEAEIKVEAFHAEVSAEVEAYSKQRQIARQTGRNLKFAALILLAESLGESASKTGNPSPEASDNFLGAMIGRKLSYEQRAEIARKANAKVPYGNKPVAVITAKANDQRGAQSYRFNLPVMTKEALG